MDHTDSDDRPSALKTIQWFWEHEHQLPKDPTRLLQHIGWVWAQEQKNDEAIVDPKGTRKSWARAYGRPCGTEEERESELYIWNWLRDDLHRAVCLDERAYVKYDDFGERLERPYELKVNDKKNLGWVLEEVACLRRINGNIADRRTYSYYHGPTPSHPHKVKRRTLEWAQQSPSVHYARFRLNGVWIYYYQHYNLVCFLLNCDWSFGSYGDDYYSEEDGARMEERDLVVEAVRALPGRVQYVRYDQNTNVIFSTNTYLDTYAVFCRQTDLLTDRLFKNCMHFSLDDLIDHNFERFEDRADDREVANTYPAMRRLFFNDHSPWQNTVEFKKVSILLTRQLRSRLGRVGYKLLLAKAEEGQERIAADPVKKRAACAAVVAEHLKVLAMVGDVEESPSKRQRV